MRILADNFTAKGLSTPLNSLLLPATLLLNTLVLGLLLISGLLNLG